MIIVVIIFAVWWKIITEKYDNLCKEVKLQNLLIGPLSYHNKSETIIFSSNCSMTGLKILSVNYYTSILMLNQTFETKLY